jgi:hypothetical protein
MVANALALGLHLAVICNEDLPLAKESTDRSWKSTGRRAADGRQKCGSGLHDPVRSTVRLLMLTGNTIP